MSEEYKFSSSEFPVSPGVYLMKNAKGRIIYIGKAKNLRSRLSSYFRSPAGLTPKTRALVGNIARVEVLHVSSEKEALLLEESLIKKHKPRYNIILRDDKQYILFRLDKQAAFPRLAITRKVIRDGSIYYGPFTSAQAARTTWKLLGNVFLLRKCSDKSFRNRVRPCLYYHIKQCMAPCVLDVDRDVYRAHVRQVEFILGGKTGELLQDLKRKMVAASEKLAFEEAAELRDQIRAVEKTVERQAAVLPGGGDRDVIALAETGKGLGLGLAFIRQGRLLDEKQFFWAGLTLDEAPEALESFLAQFYTSTRFIPPVILTPIVPEDVSLAEVLGDRRGQAVSIRGPKSAQEKGLVDIARNVARRAVEKERSLAVGLQQGLRLSSEPERIECVDASHLGGEGMRVGQVVFEDGRRNKEASRLYAFPDLEGTGDDYAALAAWAVRRVESGPPWPDLVLLDGGKGQLAAVERALSDCEEAAGWELASIAKGPTRRAGELEDRIFRPGRVNHMPLKPGSPELLFLQRVRDETHRYTIGAQRKSRKKKLLHSEILGIEGVGPKTARMLWDTFGSLDRMLAADISEIENVPGLGKKKAAAIRTALDAMREARKN